MHNMHAFVAGWTWTDRNFTIKVANDMRDLSYHADFTGRGRARVPSTTASTR